MKEKKSFSNWVKEHKKAIIVTGVGIAAIAGGIVIGEKWGTTCEVPVELPKPRTRNNLLSQTQNIIEAAPDKSELTEVLKMTTSKVKGFIRTLPEGQHASELKKAKAVEIGLEMADNQTLVEEFTRTRSA